jgi:hypothetical protein
VDSVQAGKDLEKALPEHHHIVDCRGSVAIVEEVSQIPTVHIFQYQAGRAKLSEGPVELD